VHIIMLKIFLDNGSAFLRSLLRRSQEAGGEGLHLGSGVWARYILNSVLLLHIRWVSILEFATVHLI